MCQVVDVPDDYERQVVGSQVYRCHSPKPHAFQTPFSFVTSGGEAEAVGQSLAGQCFEVGVLLHCARRCFGHHRTPLAATSQLSCEDHKVLVFVSQKQYADELANKLCEARPLISAQSKAFSLSVRAICSGMFWIFWMYGWRWSAPMCHLAPLSTTLSKLHARSDIQAVSCNRVLLTGALFL